MLFLSGRIWISSLSDNAEIKNSSRISLFAFA
jgi:hypothetical protein